MKKLFLLSTLFIFVVAGTPLPGFCDYNVTCIDPNGMKPDINNLGHVVWVAPDPADGGDWEIFLFDGSATSQVTANDTSDDEPRINDAGQIAWFGMGTAFPSSRQVHFFNGSAIEKRTDSAWWKYNLGLNSQGQTAWDGLNYADGTDFEVFFYDGTVQRLTNNANGLTDINPRINDRGEVVWQGKIVDAYDDYEIFFYDGTLHQLTNDNEHQENPDINSSSHLVWEAVDPGSGGYDIFYDDGVTVTNLTNDSPRDFMPRISDSGHVAFLKENGATWDIYYYDGTGNALLASDVNTGFGYHDISNGGYVTWVADDGGDTDIFVFDGTATTQLTSDDSDDKFPRVNDSGAVVWQSAANGICLAEIAAPPPADPVPVVYHPATRQLDIPEVLIGGTSKAYSVLMQQLDGPGYVFQLAKAKKTAPTGNAAAMFGMPSGILEITLLEIDGMARTWRVLLQKEPGGGYVFRLMQAKKN